MIKNLLKDYEEVKKEIFEYFKYDWIEYNIEDKTDLSWKQIGEWDLCLFNFKESKVTTYILQDVDEPIYEGDDFILYLCENENGEEVCVVLDKSKQKEM